MTRLILRSIAIAIAVIALVDPAISLSGSTRARLAVVELDPAGPIGPALHVVRDRLVRDLGSSFEIVPQITSDAAAAIVIGDRYPPESIPDAIRVSTVTVAPAATGMRIVRIDAPAEVPPGTAIHLDVGVEGTGMAGQSSDVRVSIAGIEMGRASHAWTSARERWRAAFDAVPVGDPPYIVRVADRAIVVGARRRPLRVEIYEPRPSWASTFVRRALETDPRFQVASVSMTSRGIASRAGEAVPLIDANLDRFDVVAIGGLDRLTAADVRAVDRFMRERGGAVFLLPDARLEAGPARDLIPVELKERLLERPTKLATQAPSPAFEASELLVATDRSPERLALHVIASTTGGDAAPVVVSAPRGAGRLVWSGAMDAWRFRANDDGAFDRFWQSTIAGLALAVPPPVDVRIEPPLLAPHETGDVIVRVRSRPLNDAAPASATIDGTPIRLRPDPEAGVYRGTFVARDTPGRSRVDVRVDGTRAQSASATIVVDQDAHRVDPESPAPLSMLATSHGGVDATPDRLDTIEQWARGAVSTPATREARHPMRSAWWMIPFTACLAGEWWLRRRAGQR
ncbi:MAG: hypothetical protein LAO77_08380 [Acidobacteriia bacterium]|nr:hypothetical protein [Terriglobia bacterium]